MTDAAELVKRQRLDRVIEWLHAHAAKYSQIDPEYLMCTEAAETLRLAAQQDGAWQPIETAPMDTPVLLGWWQDWPRREWRTDADAYGCARGGWHHGQATHWQPLPKPPVCPEQLHTKEER